MSVTQSRFGTDKEGKALSLYTIRNGNGTLVQVTDLGATIVSIQFQDKNEKMQDLVLGYDSPEGYYKGGCYFGACIGRSGNRIDKARFALNGQTYQLTVNDNQNNLHSGPDGFDKRTFTLTGQTDSSVTLAVEDADLRQGYPGNFKASVTYTLTEDDRLLLQYQAESDRDTVCNLTNHTYFNLGGHDSGSIEDTVLQLEARAYTPVRDHEAIPTGEIAPVAGTPFDFTELKTIGRDIAADCAQLKYVGGYDHNFVLQRERTARVKFAEAYQPKTGICMEAFTDLPGFQFYAGNFITDGEKGKNGAVYGKRCGFCLETQYFPNSINQDGFLKPILRAGETFQSTTCYKFSVH